MSCQPVGESMLVGLIGIKLSPGIHENQNVPIVVVPILSRVKLYWYSPGESKVSVKVADASMPEANKSGAAAQIRPPKSKQ